MSLEVHKYIEKAIDKKENFYNAEVINFPNDQKINIPKDLVESNYTTWKLYDKSSSKEDGDQLKAVLGICLMLTALIIMGLYSNLV